MTKFGIDATSTVPPNAAHAVGVEFQIRYLSRYTAKVVDAAQYQLCRQNNIGLVAVFEDGADNALLGYDQGKADAEWALKQGGAAGMTRDRPVPFAVDFDPAGSPERVLPYFEGCAAVMGRQLCGPYGAYSVCNFLADKGFKFLYQTYAWSAGEVEKRAQLLQYSNDHFIAGIGVDFDHAFTDDYGQWGYTPKSADPNHYLRFGTGPYPWKKGLVYPRTWVKQYDALRPNWNKPGVEPQLKVLQSNLHLCAERIWFRAHQDLDLGEFNLPVNWTPFHWGWQFQQLIHRAQGHRLGVGFQP